MSNCEIGLSDFDFEDCQPIADCGKPLVQKKRAVRDSNYKVVHVAADTFYVQNSNGRHVARRRLVDLQYAFQQHVMQPYCTEKATRKAALDSSSQAYTKHKDKDCLFSDINNSALTDDTSEEEEAEESDESESESEHNAAIERKRSNPNLLHPELWYNEPGEMNDGPLCRCCWKARQRGIAHEIYVGEEAIVSCDLLSNNIDQLYYYKLCVSPDINLSKEYSTTVISMNNKAYRFDGFGILSHQQIPDEMPQRMLERWNIEYTLTLEKEMHPIFYTVEDCNLFWRYFFVNLMELYDVNLFPSCSQAAGCPAFHAIPRFVHFGDREDAVEMLPMSAVLEYLFYSCQSVFPASLLHQRVPFMSPEWSRMVSSLKGQLISNPKKVPAVMRLDQIDRVDAASEVITDWPIVVHFGVRPVVMTYSGNPEYLKLSKKFRKFRHTLMMKPRLSAEDKRKLADWEERMQNIRENSNSNRDVTIEVSSQGFNRTGIYSDMVQHGLMLIAMFRHVRFHLSLQMLEKRLQHRFKDRALLELSLTHPSYRPNYATNADHVRNTLSNCGLRKPEYGVKRFSSCQQRKRGIRKLVEVMSHTGFKTVKESEVSNNERLEFLGDSVIEFLTTIHLYFMFPDLEEGGLATFRSCLVQNSHLAVLARKLGLDNYMLYAHGPDLCHEADLKHAMANAFEALLGALFLDGGIELADRVYGSILFSKTDEPEMHWIWSHPPKHPLQTQEPNGDRYLVDNVEFLKRLSKFENDIGISFTHIRLLARAFTRKSVGYNFLTLGHNQRMEFLGDTVLQLITSEYLYKYFPAHQEGHLSLLRSCLVSNKTQAVICDDIGMAAYVHPPVTVDSAAHELRMKDKADLVEAFIGALFVDKGIEHCKLFCQLCFFPRLKYFIMKQQWSDPKTRLQQCCLTWRDPNGGEPEIPRYKIVTVEGAANTRVYKVAVYFRHSRLAVGYGPSIKDAEIDAAEQALKNRSDLLPNIMKPNRR